MKLEVAAVVCGVAFGLAGCAAPGGSEGTGPGGSAARSAAGGISQQELAAEVDNVQAAMGMPTNQPSSGLAVANLQRMIQDLLISVEAQRLGISVTEAQVQKAVTDLAASNGGMEVLSSSAIQAGIAPQAIDDVVRTNLLLDEIGKALVSGDDRNSQLQAAQQALADLSTEVDLQVAPRYGAWDAATLSIKDVSEVSRPAEAQAQ